MPPKEGHWIPIGYEEVIMGVCYIKKQCSECGYSHTLHIPDNYCPKCGSHNEGKYRPSIQAFLHEHYKQKE